MLTFFYCFYCIFLWGFLIYCYNYVDFMGLFARYFITYILYLVFLQVFATIIRWSWVLNFDYNLKEFSYTFLKLYFGINLPYRFLGKVDWTLSFRTRRILMTKCQIYGHRACLSILKDLHNKEYLFGSCISLLLLKHSYHLILLSEIYLWKYLRILGPYG